MLDRRSIFLVIAFAVGIPLVLPLHLPNQVTPAVQQIYNLIEELPAGSTILISFDHEASTIAEVRPLATALLSHLFSRHIKVVGISLLAEGTGIGSEILHQVAQEFQKHEGQDFAFLGFRPQYAATISGLAEEIRRVYPTDYRGIPLNSLPLFDSLKNLSNTALVISVADGDLPSWWVDYAGARYRQKIIGAVTAVMATTFYPYLNSGQLVGLISGLKGAAEYEILLRRPGAGLRGMDAQSVAHITLLVLIGFSNLSYLRRKRFSSSLK